MKKIIIIIVSVFILGCTSAKSIMTPSGAQGLKIWCELPSQCYDRAAKECPTGYTVHAKDKNYLGLGDIDGMLIIECKNEIKVESPKENKQKLGEFDTY